MQEVQKVTKDMAISKVLEMDMETAQFFMEMGMYCFGCPIAQDETIEEACMASGTDADELVDKINEYLASK